MEDNTPLIYRVIGEMGLSQYEVDEAFSEGLVGLARAELSFDPNNGTPQASWLAMNIRWSIADWITAERNRRNQQLPELPDIEARRNTLSSTVEYNELLRNMREVLTEEERLVIMAVAYGFQGKEIAERIGRSQSYVSEVKWRAKQKLLALRKEQDDGEG